ncbi:MAG: cytochrome ubiquinol oxidase subunit I [Archaeoglobaceae archaeon]|uniref:Cytochrome oxidase subunit I n=1 Tax=Archaeoglobus fulgidus TaxID=2234 RepID=A0A7J3M1Q2_ARCFL
MSDFPFVFLGFAVLLHVLFVSITIGTGWITAYSRLKSYLNSDAYLEKFARKAFRILVVFELFSGVWGTIITVILAGFFPGLTALATNVLFTPMLIALIAIMLRIPSIAVFWYTWGKLHPKAHSLVGLIMAISGFLVPFGFRAVFSEISSPTAVAEFIGYGFASPFTAYTSVMFWLLYLHTIFASLSVSGFVVAFLNSLEKDDKGLKIGYSYGIAFLFAQIPIGAIYWLSHSYYSTYIFETITFGNFLPIFIAKLTVITLLLILGIFGYLKRSISALLVVLSLFAVFFGELMNDGARYPYMVVLGNEGIHFRAFSNFYIDIPTTAVLLILAFLLISVIVFLTAVFYALFKRYLAEIPES